ncbi:Rne/Rng family ribonuclease [Priestia megaterium]|nr:Rne/Rng family ribonuclease [Priestia megaterium]
MKICVINAATQSKRIAILNDSQLEELYLEEQNKHQIVGDIYLGRVVKVLPNIQAAFVDIGLSMNGFIHQQDLMSYQMDSEREKATKPISSFVREGEAIVVQVIKEGIGTKGPRLTGIIELATNEVVYLPHGKYVAVSKKLTDEERSNWKQVGHELIRADEGVVLRTGVQALTKAEVEARILALRDIYKVIEANQKRQKAPSLLKKGEEFILSLIKAAIQKGAQALIIDDFKWYQQLTKQYQEAQITYYQQKENIFSAYGIEQQIDKLLKRVVWLKSGGYIVIDETEAMTVIDVNTGKFSGKGNIRKTILQTNKEAANEIAKQLKLRHIGGMVLIDFINMNEKEDREQVHSYMRALCQKDDVRTTVVGFTELGILQLTRKKVRDSIGRTLTTACQACNGTGQMMSPETIAFQIERKVWEYRSSTEEAMWIETREDVVTHLKRDGFLQELEQLVNLKIYVTPTLFGQETYHIRQLGSIAQICERIRA